MAATNDDDERKLTSMWLAVDKRNRHRIVWCVKDMRAKVVWSIRRDCRMRLSQCSCVLRVRSPELVRSFSHRRSKGVEWIVRIVLMEKTFKWTY
jgi:hypothetical protein